MSDCFLGEIRIFASIFAPQNWILCDGQQLKVQQYQALFSLIGATYGGDKVTVFNVPDLRGSLPVGQGANTTTNPPLSQRVIGQTGGEEVHELILAELPAHTHPVFVSTTSATDMEPSPAMLYGSVQSNDLVKGLYTQAVQPSATAVTMAGSVVEYVGNNVPHNNVMRTTALNYIMAVVGQYPPRPN